MAGLLQISLILLISIEYSMARPNHKDHGHNLNHLKKYLSSSSEEIFQEDQQHQISKGRAVRSIRGDSMCHGHGRLFELPQRKAGHREWCDCDPHYAGRFCEHFETFVCETNNDCLDSTGDFTCQRVHNSDIKYCLPNPF